MSLPLYCCHYSETLYATIKSIILNLGFFGGETMNRCIYIFPIVFSLLTNCATKKSESSEPSPDKEQASEKKMALYRTSPIQGLLSGNTSLTLVGENFHPKSKVTIGDTACLNVVVNKEETRITCLTPPSQQTSAQTVTVTVTSPNGQSSEQKDVFTYVSGVLSEFADSLKRDRTILSIGFRCTARHSLQTLYYKIDLLDNMETNFFDWIFSRDFGAVIDALSTDVNTVKDRLAANNTELSKLENDAHYRIKLKDFLGFESIHDVDIEVEKDKDPTYLNQKINRDFSQKYQRRFERFISKIKKNPQIFFLRWEEGPLLSEIEVKNFMGTLEKLNPKNQDYLILVGVHRQTPELAQAEKLYRFKYFNLLDLKKLRESPTPGWDVDHYDWESIFKWIEDNSSGSKESLFDKGPGPKDQGKPAVQKLRENPTPVWDVNHED